LVRVARYETLLDSEPQRPMRFSAVPLYWG
jgi:hypothetical protein